MSDTTSYASGADLLKRYDSRIIGDLVNDNNTRVDATSLSTNANVQAALDDATGLINSAVLVGNRYSPSDLLALRDVDQAFLIRLTCNIAYGLLVLRRGQAVDELHQYKEALDMLEHIRGGSRVFAVLGNEEAGNPTGSFPSFSVYSNLRLMRDLSKVFPVRRDQRVTQ